MPFLMGDDLLFYHTPKCGGTWIRYALRSAGVPWKLIPEHHQHGTSAEIPEKYKRGYTPFCVIRKPETWFQSNYAFKMKRNGHRWTSDHPQAELWYAPTFAESMERYLTELPGHVSRYFYKYTAPCKKNVLRQEHLADDLVDFLRRVGVQFSEERLRATPAKNTTDSAACEYAPGQIERVRKVEAWTYKKFYGEG